jgi:Zn-dependent protease
LLFEPASVYVTRAIVFLVAMTVHEFAHAYVAYQNGDPTAKEMGKMSLNPIKNINPMGYFMGVFLGFGFLGSVPVVAQRMRDPRWGTFQAVLAGPISNLLLAAVFAVPLRFGLVEPSFTPADGLIPTPGYLLSFMVYLNVLLFIFNLIPLFPLDGWTIVLAALPPGPAVEWQRFRQASYYIFLGLILLSFVGAGRLPNILEIVVGTPTELITRGLLGL